MITVEVEAAADEPPLPVTHVQRLVKEVLSSQGNGDARVAVLFSDDEHLRELKQKFLNIDAYTDVIAFELNSPGEPLDAEIYISVDRAAENSVMYNEPLTRELGRLVLHGALHLMGHQDDSPEKRKRMRALEDRYLDALSRPG